MKKCGALLLFLLCLCECGVQGEREWVPTVEQRLTLLEARLSAVVSSMDHEAEADLREYYEKRLDGLAKQNEELQSRLDSSDNITQVLQSSVETLTKQIEDVELVKDKLANLTERYGDLESRYHQLQTQVDQFQSSYQQQVINPEGRKKRLCDYELVKDDLAKLTERYGDLESSNHQLQTKLDQTTEQKDQLQTKFDQTTEQKDQLQSSNHQLQTQFDQLQSSYQQLNSTCNPVPVTENPEDRKKMLKRLCESFKWVDGVCYYLSTERKTWDESRRFCTARQADLIIINTQEKQDFLVSLNQRLWIGLTDIDQERNWKWVNGTHELTTSEFWNDGEPNNGHKDNEEDCAEVKGGGWNDIPCDERRHFICEIVI